MAIGTKYIYRELLKKIVEMFKTGKPPIDIARDAGDRGLHRGGLEEREQPRDGAEGGDLGVEMALGRPFSPVKTERNNSLPGKVFR